MTDIKEILEKHLEKERVIKELCVMVDQLYFYAKELIPKETTHNLGFRKEKLKRAISIKIKEL